MGGWYGVAFCVVSCMRPTVYNAPTLPTLFILYRVVEANSITLALGEGGEEGGGGGGGATHLHHLHLTFFDVPQRFGF